MPNFNIQRCKSQDVEVTPLSSPSIPVEQVSNQFLAKKHEAARILGISSEALKKYRQQGKLIEGIHYYRWNSRTIRYNSVLLKDWAVNRDNPEALQRGIEVFLKSLPSNQSKRHGRKA